MNERRLYRSQDDRIIAGVAGGMAEYFDVDPVIVRILWFLSMIITATVTFWAYIIMALVVPPEPSDWPEPSPWAPGGAPIPGTSAGPGSPGDAATSGPADASGGASSDPNAPQGTAPDATGNPPSSAGPVPGDYWSSQSRPDQWQSRADQWQSHADRWQYRAERQAERWQRRMERRAYRHEHGSGGLIFGLLLILVGAMLAWHQLVPSFDLGITWPIAIVALGAVLIVSAIQPRRHD